MGGTQWHAYLADFGGVEELGTVCQLSNDSYKAREEDSMHNPASSEHDAAALVNDLLASSHHELNEFGRTVARRLRVLQGHGKKFLKVNVRTQLEKTD